MAGQELTPRFLIPLCYAASLHHSALTQAPLTIKGTATVMFSPTSFSSSLIQSILNPLPHLNPLKFCLHHHLLGSRDISLLLAHLLFSLLLVWGLWLPLWEASLPHPKPTWLDCFSFTSFKATMRPGLANESSTISQATVTGQGPGMGPEYRKMRPEVGEGYVLQILGNPSFLSLLQKLEEETLCKWRGVRRWWMEVLQQFCCHTGGGPQGAIVSPISTLWTGEMKKEKPGIWVELLDQIIPEKKWPLDFSFSEANTY